MPLQSHSPQKKNSGHAKSRYSKNLEILPTLRCKVMVRTVDPVDWLSRQLQQHLGKPDVSLAAGQNLHLIILDPRCFPRSRS